MTDTKLSDLTLKTGNMVASDLVEITEGGNTTKSVTGTKIINMVTSSSVVTANTAKISYPGSASTKLAGIEANATADQSNAEIRTAVEAATDSNVFTDADHTKLNAIEASATADQTDAEIRTAVEAASDSNVFTDADHTKLNAVEASADVTDSTNVVAALTAGTGITIASNGTIAADPVALTTVQVASSQSAQLALTAQEGDVVVRSDEDKTYMHNGGTAGNMNDYTFLSTPTGGVSSVNGVTGTVTAAHIATAVEAASGSNTFTDADHSKLNAIAVAGSSSIVTTGALNSGSITSGFGTINNGASAITTTGVITGGTVEATTDTAAGDNAAMGYTAAEGLILTGQGSSNDVTIKNDADATVMSIATGTTNTTFAGDVNLGLNDLDQVRTISSSTSLSLHAESDGGTGGNMGLYTSNTLALRLNANNQSANFFGDATFAGDVTLGDPSVTGSQLLIEGFSSAGNQTSSKIIFQNTTAAPSDEVGGEIRIDTNVDRRSYEMVFAVGDSAVLTDALTINGVDSKATFSGDVTVDGIAKFKGVSRFLYGTVGGPGIAFDGDPNTGFYRIASDHIGISTGGVKRFDINSTGATFAGDVTIDKTLFVGGSDTANVTAIFQSTDSIAAIGFADNASTSTTHNQIGTTGDEVFIKAGATEVATFHATNGTTFTKGVNLGSATVEAANFLYFGKRVTSNEGNLPFITQASDILSGDGNDLALGAHSGDGGISFWTGASSGSTPFTSSNDMRMSINAAGLVNIYGALTVGGTIGLPHGTVLSSANNYISSLAFAGTTARLRMLTGDTTLRGALYASAAGVGLLSQTGVAVLMVQGSAATFAGNATFAGDVTISGGNVGVGTAASTRAIDVLSATNDTLGSGVRAKNSNNGTAASANFTVVSASSSGGLLAYPSNSTVSDYADRIVLKTNSDAAGLTLSTGVAGGDIVLRTASDTTALTLDSSQNATFAGTITGNGSGLTALNGSNISSGTIAAARVATLNQNTTGASGSITAVDTRAAARAPNDYADRAATVEFTNDFPTLGAWGSAITIKGWADGYNSWQLMGNAANNTTDQNLYYRHGLATSWTTLAKIWSDANFTAGTGATNWCAGNDSRLATQTTVTGSSGSCTGNAATVTNGVYTTGTQTIGGAKTFSNNATFAGDVIVDTGANAASITINSPSQVWSGGEDLGGINWYTEDTSGNAPGVIAKMYVESKGGNTLPIAEMVFSSSTAASTAQIEHLRFDPSGGVSTATFAGDVSVETSGVPTLAGGSPYGLLVKSGGANSNGTYQGSIGFTESTGTLVRSAIMSKQTGADNDQNGLAFMTHPSASNVDGAIALLLEHDKSATFAGAVNVAGTLTVDAGSSGMIDFGDVTSAYGRLFADSSGTYVGSKSNHPLKLRTNNAIALTLDTSQNATFAGQLQYVGASAGLVSTTSGTADNTISMANTNNQSYIGINGATGNRFSGSTAYFTTLGTSSAYGLELATNNTVRMSINSAGNATFAGTVAVPSMTMSGYGTPVNTSNLDSGMYGIYNASRTGHIWSMGTAYKISPTGANFGNLYGLAYKHTNNTSGGTMASGHMMVWCQNGSGKAAMGTNIWTSGNVIAYSDARVKTNIEVIDNALDKVCQLSGYTFDRTDQPDLARQTGVIAQEVIKVLPEAVLNGPTDEDPDGHYSVAYGNMVGLLIESTKEINKKVTSLEAENTLLKSQLEAVMARLDKAGI